jgi:hypothetical protein
MAGYIPIPKDLTKVKTKIAFNLTKKQLICFGLAAAVGIPAYIFSRAAIGNTTAVLLMIGLMMPFFLLAMFEKDGQPAEKALRNIIRAKFWPSVRPYKTENMYKYLDKGGNSNAVIQTAEGKAKAKTNGSSSSAIKKAKG